MPRVRVALACAFALLAAASDAVADVIHTVRQGDTLASIAQRYYGDVSREAVLVAANTLHAQANTSLLVGMHLVVPAVSYYRVLPGDTWLRIATRELGSPTRAGYLAAVNHSDLPTPPALGAVLRIPYLLRYLVTGDEPLYELARRFYGDRSQVQFLLQFNHLTSVRLQRGQVLLIPLSELSLRNEPASEETRGLADTHRAQQQLEERLPALAALVSRGLYVEAVAQAARLRASEELTAAQRVSIDRSLAEAYCALDRADLAAEAFRDALAAQPELQLDAVTTSPRVLDAFLAARGVTRSRALAPAPSTGRPDDAH